MNHERDAEQMRILMRETIRAEAEGLLPARELVLPPRERLAAFEQRQRAHASRITRRQLRQLRAASKRCYLCRQPIGSDFEIDHIIPISLGGEHRPENLALTHPKCNRAKAAQIVAIDVITRQPRYT